MVKRLLDTGAKVVDLSADFRLDAATYTEWYGEHPYPGDAPGGVRADGAASSTRSRERTSSPTPAATRRRRCSPSSLSSELGLLDVVIDAKSGVSGAGKTPTESTHFCSVDSDLVAYGIQGHRHYPEIAAGLAEDEATRGAPGAAVFGAAPATASRRSRSSRISYRSSAESARRSTCGRRPSRCRAQAEVRTLYEDRYAGEPFVAVCDAPPRLRDVTGTNCCRVFPHVDERAGRIVVISVIDNLMKGASGQAVQNMNLMLGLPETAGLL